ncbi:MAG TPA: nicotinate (nicotinamide) nucleotide adenylyltransferase [Chlamydiales bacterium]|nr:nicotinate (nicotinamide) nucleotide adenylyltransferase [Chlamydiales bacterium]
MSKIAFFGGSFDPIHLGHLFVALQLLEERVVDHIYFSPAYQSPHKLNMSSQASAEKRLEMVKLAIAGIEGCYCYEGEALNPQTSFTVDSLKRFKENFTPEDEIYFILAEDAAATFHLWKNPETILELARPIIVGRSGSQESFKKYRLLSEENFIPIKKFDISSTEIRERLKKSLYVKHLLLDKVIDYIYQNQLYYTS